MKTKKRSKQHFYKKKIFLWPVGMLLGLLIAILIAFRVSPWPGAMVIRSLFNKGAHKTLIAMEAHTPGVPISVLSNQSYRFSDKDAVLDVYFPASVDNTNQRLPVIVWTHGGAWLSGDKSDDAPYFKLLAAQGYTVIAPNYSLAPEHTYPTPIYQLNDAYSYIQTNAARFHVDTNKFILAGDSAGSQLSSQMAAFITNPTYAYGVGITPKLKPSQLRGVILYCGIYAMDGLVQPNPTLPKIVGWGNDISVWAYSGLRDVTSPLIRQMSPYYHTTSTFPATFISGGNGDLLTIKQSMPFASELKSLGVSVTTLFYTDNHQPSLLHEYQFDLDNTDGQNAFKSTVSFISGHTH